MARYFYCLFLTIIIDLLLLIKNADNSVVINKLAIVDDSQNVILMGNYSKQASTVNLNNSTTAVSTTTSNNNSNGTETKEKPCKCASGVCSCCSKLLYDRWKQKACVEVIYDPDEFSFTAKVMFNDRVLYTRSVSGKNPRPICVPFPRIPLVRACVRFYNIYFQGRNIHMCVSMEGKFDDTTLVKAGLDCIRMGANGVAIVRPEDGTGIGQLEFLPDSPEDNSQDDDDYSNDNNNNNDNENDSDEDDDDEDDDDDYL